jgi:nicotinate dehydrogenase subunit A
MQVSAPRTIEFRVNTKSVTITADPRTPLLYILRNDVGLNGPKYGCGLGECGACNVLVDGRLARSCVVPLQAVESREVVTLEGLGDRGEPGPVQAAFVKEQAAQCGYCLNGMILTAHALLATNPDPTDEQIAHALRFNLCRCGTHIEIMRAVRTAATMIRERR